MLVVSHAEISDSVLRSTGTLEFSRTLAEPLVQIYLAILIISAGTNKKEETDTNGNLHPKFRFFCEGQKRRESSEPVVRCRHLLG